MSLGEVSTEKDPSQSGTRLEYTYSSSILPGIVQVLDITMLAIAGIIPYVIFCDYNHITVKYYIFGVVFVDLVAVLLLAHGEMYEQDAIMRPVARSDFIIVAVVTAFLFFLTVTLSLKVTDIFSDRWLYWFGIAAIAFVAAGRLFAYRCFQRLSRRGVIGRNMVILAAGEAGRRTLGQISTVRPHFTSVLGVFSPDPASLAGEGHGQRILGGPDDLVRYVRAHRVDDVVLALPWNSDDELIDMIERLKELPINVQLSTGLTGYQLAFRPAMGQTSEVPLFEITRRPISGWSSFFKAAEDYILASLILILLSPLLVLIAIAIKIDSPGPVFFMQRRLGFNNKEFLIYKFRSMYHSEIPETRVKQATRRDPRITRVGRFIRRTSLDELPQLINVLNGTMSIVGPRPHAVQHNEEFGQQIRGYFARHRVKPGITGWAQVNGLRGETDAISKMEKRVKYDIFYADNWSLLFDLRILFMTMVLILFQKSAY